MKPPQGCADKAAPCGWMQRLVRFSSCYLEQGLNAVPKILFGFECGLHAFCVICPVGGVHAVEPLKPLPYVFSIGLERSPEMNPLVSLVDLHPVFLPDCDQKLQAGISGIPKLEKYSVKIGREFHLGLGIASVPINVETQGYRRQNTNNELDDIPHPFGTSHGDQCEPPIWAMLLTAMLMTIIWSAPIIFFLWKTQFFKRAKFGEHWGRHHSPTNVKAHPPLGAKASVERGVEVVVIIKAGKQSGS